MTGELHLIERDLADGPTVWAAQAVERLAELLAKWAAFTDRHGE